MIFDAALFDLGGTLIRYENRYSWRELALLGCRRAVPFLRDSTGAELDAEELTAALLEEIQNSMRRHEEEMAEIVIEDLVRRVLSGFGIIVNEDLARKFIEVYYRPTTEQIAPEKGGSELLSKLKRRGMTLGLVSNSIFPAEFHRAEMERFGLLAHLDFTIFSSEYGMRKPSREIYRRALEMAGTEPGRTVFVGNSMLEDIAGPRKLGMRAILKKVDGKDYALDEKPFRIIKELGELETILTG